METPHGVNMYVNMYSMNISRLKGHSCDEGVYCADGQFETVCRCFQLHILFDFPVDVIWRPNTVNASTEVVCWLQHRCFWHYARREVRPPSRDSRALGRSVDCSILRVFFWFGDRYETSLLCQSILMIAVQVRRHILVDPLTSSVYS